MVTNATWLLNCKRDKKGKGLLHVTDLAVAMDLSEEAKREMVVLSEKKNSACYTFNADSWNSEELHNPGTG